jgi:hypothetical protein
MLQKPEGFRAKRSPLTKLRFRSLAKIICFNDEDWLYRIRPLIVNQSATISRAWPLPGALLIPPALPVVADFRCGKRLDYENLIFFGFEP